MIEGVATSRATARWQLNLSSASDVESSLTRTELKTCQPDVERRHLWHSCYGRQGRHQWYSCRERHQQRQGDPSRLRIGRSSHECDRATHTPRYSLTSILEIFTLEHLLDRTQHPNSSHDEARRTLLPSRNPERKRPPIERNTIRHRRLPRHELLAMESWDRHGQLRFNSITSGSISSPVLVCIKRSSTASISFRSVWSGQNTRFQ